MEILQHLNIGRKLQVTLWKEGDDDFEYIFASRIIAHGGDVFQIETPDPLSDELLSLIEPGVVVGVMMYGIARPYIFYPKIEFFQAETPVGLWLEIPPEIVSDAIQRRQHVRIDMNLPLQVDHQIGTEGPWQTEQVTTVDVSGGGCKITCNYFFSVDEEVRIDIQFRPEVPKMKLMGSVVFCRDNTTIVPGKYMAALRFLHLRDQDVMIIMAECFKRELASRKKT